MIIIITYSRRIYLDELSDITEVSMGVGLLQLVVAGKKQAPSLGQRLVEEVNLNAQMHSVSKVL